VSFVLFVDYQHFADIFDKHYTGLNKERFRINCVKELISQYKIGGACINIKTGSLSLSSAAIVDHPKSIL
jgi:hypothetical protein